MKIFAVRIGDKYGPEYETYLEDKLSDYELVWIREPYHPEVKLQWNKMWAMQTGIDEPVCVMDIDVVLINDFKKIFDKRILLQKCCNPTSSQIIFASKNRCEIAEESLMDAFFKFLRKRLSTGK